MGNKWLTSSKYGILPVFWHSTYEAVGHDDDAREENRETKQEKRAKLILSHVTKII